MSDEHDWEEQYRTHPELWSGRPNAALVAAATALPPGSALDIGCGEGADAVWLAARGWRVTAVDLSRTALERGRAHAAVQGVDVAARITWEQGDVTAWVPEERHFDLVSTQFMHLPGEARRVLFARLAAAVAPGGTLLVVGHDPSDLNTLAPRPPAPDLFFTAGEVADSLEGSEWEVLVAEARPRPAGAHETPAVTVHDAVLVARKRL
jgi:SAM-dependent methyltransferase